MSELIVSYVMGVCSGVAITLFISWMLAKRWAKEMAEQ